MKKSLKFLTVSFALLCLLAVGIYLRKAQAQAAPDFPILDMVANKVIQKYQQSTCEQLWVKKSQKAPPTAEEQKVIGFLQSRSTDAQPHSSIRLRPQSRTRCSNAG